MRCRAGARAGVVPITVFVPVFVTPAELKESECYNDVGRTTVRPSRPGAPGRAEAHAGDVLQASSRVALSWSRRGNGSIIAAECGRVAWVYALAPEVLPVGEILR